MNGLRHPLQRLLFKSFPLLIPLLDDAFKCLGKIIMSMLDAVSMDF
jgi:hypothetical protein